MCELGQGLIVGLPCLQDEQFKSDDLQAPYESKMSTFVLGGVSETVLAVLGAQWRSCFRLFVSSKACVVVAVGCRVLCAVPSRGSLAAAPQEG